ncbi:hypothetical protein [Salinarimonas ramus]|uniref:MoaD/ThiS family protein n=1 Tax=Salinarimonas ramus TaxID=690164 RepID=A0A917Q4N3_9HYPH|nr:hypothetical protein [Salinarimonas ramus]GGK21239.1 hypothetical protein GCM10011322_04870 [Salinarimonas ramus]
MLNVKVATRLREIYEIPPGAYKVEADTVDSVIAKLDADFPGIRGDVLLQEGGVRPDVVIYLDGEPLAATETARSVAGVSTMRIVQAMAGG